MLKRFEVENFKNFKDKFVFDLSETKNYEFNPECVQNGLVSKAIIYGVNGCGKSNLGLAIFDLSHNLDGNLPSSFLSREYVHYLNAASTEETAKFKFVFQFDQTEATYCYEKKAVNEITREQLYINGEEVVHYVVGEPLQVNLKGAETLNTDLRGSKISSAISYVARNAALEKNQTNNGLYRLFEFIGYLGIVIPHKSFEDFAEEQQVTQQILRNSNVEAFQSFLEKAGVDCQLRVIKNGGKQEIAFAFGEVFIPFWDIASTGTKNLAEIYTVLLDLKSKHSYSLLVIDEFDAFYHHKLSQLIVSALKNISAQVILTTHNTSIMTNDLLRPDCYFVMHENKIDPIYKFTDKELRSAHNIEKMYKAGAFDG